MTRNGYGTVQSDGSSSNKLLAALPDRERGVLDAHLTLVDIPRRELLYEADGPIDNVYFICDGIASILSVMSDGTAVETATIGREGMVGMAIFHGVSVTSERAVMQVPGSAMRIPADRFSALLPDLPTLDALLHRFSVCLFTLAAQNSGCNRKHSIEERCCRWMLMVADRLDRNSFELTHDFIAQMLGVRRASVTETLGALEKRGLVETARGRITIVNRAGLEACACECYNIIRSNQQRLFES
jgi:CRP-like cAMP-binding protein